MPEGSVVVKRGGGSARWRHGIAIGTGAIAIAIVAGAECEASSDAVTGNVVAHVPSRAPSPCRMELL